jgi:hypothetical protein
MSGMKGALTVTAHLAANLKDTATMGKQDPYCKLVVGSTTFKTKVHNDGGRNPVWQQAFLFNLEGKEDVLHIYVMEQGTMSDSDIGRCDIDLKTLCSHLGKKAYPLVDRSNFTQSAGTMELTAEFKGTGAPPILSKSAEVFAAEQKMQQQTTSALTQSQTQQLEIERLRLQTEQLKLQAQIAQAQASQHVVQQPQIVQQPQYSQPQYNMQPVYTQPIMAQPQMLQPIIVQQPIMQPMMMQPVQVESKDYVAYQDKWAYCAKCANLWWSGGNGGRCMGTGSVHTDDGADYKFYHSVNPAKGAQDNWRWCSKCAIMCYNGKTGVCPAGGAHDHSTSGQYWAHLEKHYTLSQDNWNWCCKCSSMFHGGSIGTSRCPSGGPHDKNGSGNYHVAYASKPVKQVQQVVQQSTGGTWQDKWGWCNKCQSLFFAGGSGGRCNATGQAHTNDGGNYKLGSGETGFKGQEGWKWCNKCYCMCYSGLNAGACAAGSGHDFNGSSAYRLHQEAHTSVSQTGWNWCSGCQVIFYGPHMSTSRCVGGKAHNNNGSGNYHIAHH